MSRLAALLVLLAAPVGAQTLVAAHPVPARALIGPEDLALIEAATPGALDDPALAVGLEARVALYPGRPIRPADLGPPAVVERNQVIPLIYRQGGVTIATEGRALDRAGEGEVIRVMNLDSRTTVSARLDAAGTAHVPA